MAAFDLLGRRWAMGIIWNLSKGPATFRSLAGALRNHFSLHFEQPDQGSA